MSAWTDVWDVIKAAAGGAAATTGVTPAIGAVSSASRLASGTLGFLQALADWHLWASLGWVVLGVALMIIGLRLWAGKPALPSPPAVVPIPV